MEIEFENIMDHIVESIRAAGYEPYDQLYTPKDGTILPITVCTEDDLQEARQTAAVRHVIFGTAYCIECLAVVLIYFKKRAK